MILYYNDSYKAWQALNYDQMAVSREIAAQQNAFNQTGVTKEGEVIMATSKEYLAFILEQLSEIDGITHRSMMGEYMIYHHGKIVAYLCDNRLLVKPIPAAIKLMPDASYEPPYEGAKDMLESGILNKKRIDFVIIKGLRKLLNIQFYLFLEPCAEYGALRRTLSTRQVQEQSF